MKLLKNSLFILCLVFSGGCCLFNPNYNITDFPPPPKYKETSETPVVGFDEETKYYTITDSTMHNFLMNKVFLDEILVWKRENNIR